MIYELQCCVLIISKTYFIWYQTCYKAKWAESRASERKTTATTHKNLDDASLYRVTVIGQVLTTWSWMVVWFRSYLLFNQCIIEGTQTNLFERPFWFDVVNVMIWCQFGWSYSFTLWLQVKHIPYLYPKNVLFCSWSDSNFLQHYFNFEDLSHLIEFLQKRA